MTAAILFVPHLGVFGGVERLILSLSAHLEQRGYSVRVACFAADPGFNSANSQGISVDQLQTKRNFLTEAYVLRRYQRTMPADTRWLFFDLKSAFYNGLIPIPGRYLLHLTDPPSLLPADITKASWTVARRLSLKAKRPVIQRIRGELAHWLTKRGMRKASKTIVMTRRIAEEVQALYNVKPTVIPPGVDGTAKQKAIKYDDGPVRILSVSRLEQSKRLDYVIRALAELPARVTDGVRRDWTFDIVGVGGARESLFELTTRLNVEDRVRFHGRLCDLQVERLYLESHLFVMPAVQGYGLPALEALVRGIPVVLHADSGVSEYLADSPWVSVITKLDDLRDAIAIMFGRIRSNQLTLENMPAIPSLQHWCERITTLLFKPA